MKVKAYLYNDFLSSQLCTGDFNNDTETLLMRNYIAENQVERTAQF